MTVVRVVARAVFMLTLAGVLVHCGLLAAIGWMGRTIDQA